MILDFDEARWSQLEELLKVAQLCGDNAVNLYGPAKGVVQRIVATIGTGNEVSPAEADHALNILSTLRHSSVDAAQAYASAVARIEELMQALQPAGLKPKIRPPKS